MVQFSSFPFSGLPDLSPAEYQASSIRLSIFIIISVCAGVTALIWFISVLHHHKDKKIISYIILILIFNDILELLLSPYIVTKLLQGDRCWKESVMCKIFATLWSGLRVWGVYLEQMAMMYSINALRYPLCPDQGFFPCCFISLSITSFVICYLNDLFVFLRFPSLVLLLVTTVTSWIVTCRTPCMNQNSHITKRSKPLVMAIAGFTLTLYLLRLILYIFPVYWIEIIVMCECLFSVRVLLDPLLSLLICNKKVIEAEQIATEHNNDLTSARVEY